MSLLSKVTDFPGQRASSMAYTKSQVPHGSKGDMAFKRCSAKAWFPKACH